MLNHQFAEMYVIFLYAMFIITSNTYWQRAKQVEKGQGIVGGKKGKTEHSKRAMGRLASLFMFSWGTDSAANNEIQQLT